MQNFRKLRQGIDPAPYLAEIAAVKGVWHEQTGRQDTGTVQREALAIPIRGMVKSAQGNRPRRDVHESRWTSGSVRFPLFRQFLTEIAAEEGALLGRAKIVCLPAGRKVYPHTDRGEYYRLRNRYHLVLQSSLGSWLKAGGEEVRMQPGELWWFDNKAVHEAHNDGDEDRFHLIFDMLPAALEREVTRASRKASAAAKVTRSADV